MDRSRTHKRIENNLHFGSPQTQHTLFLIGCKILLAVQGLHVTGPSKLGKTIAHQVRFGFMKELDVRKRKTFFNEFLNTVRTIKINWQESVDGNRGIRLSCLCLVVVGLSLP